MKGHHEVKTFRFKGAELRDGIALPDNYKPFSTIYVRPDLVLIVCRKWRRDERAA